MSRFKQHVNDVANEKLAAIGEYLGSTMGSALGDQGQLSTLGFGAGGALGGGALGMLAGKGLSKGNLLPMLMGVGGAALGGAGGAGIANAINQQGTQQNMMDQAMLGGIGSALGANDETDYMQDMQIQQNQQMIGALADYLMSGSGGETNAGHSLASADNVALAKGS